MTQKEIAVSFLQMAASGDVKAAYDQFIAPDFTHHNQYFKSDRETLRRGMEDASRMNPNKALEIKKVFEDGDTVVTYSQVIRQNSEEPSIAVVHMLRFENDKIVELWDVGQQMIKDSPNEKGMF